MKYEFDEDRGYDLECIGCICQYSLNLIIDNYELNREQLLTVLFNFFAKYTDKSDDPMIDKSLKVLKKIEENITVGMPKEELLYDFEILAFLWSEVQSDEREKISKLMYDAGHTESTNRNAFKKRMESRGFDYPDGDDWT